MLLMQMKQEPMVAAAKKNDKIIDFQNKPVRVEKTKDNSLKVTVFGLTDEEAAKFDILAKIWALSMPIASTHHVEKHDFGPGVWGLHAVTFEISVGKPGSGLDAIVPKKK